jgi:hypothetical protein
MPKFPGFIGGSYVSRSASWLAQRAINLYPEPDESRQGKDPVALIGTPGIHVFTTLPTQPVRGFWAGHSNLLVVSGDHYYEVHPDGTYTDRGAVVDDGKRAQVFANGDYTMIVSGGLVYIDDGITLIQPTLSVGGTVYTDLAIDASDNTKATSAGNPFTEADENTFLNVTSGAGFTVQRVEILSVSANVATFAAALGSTSSTGGHATQDYGYLAAVMGAYVSGYFVALVPDSKRWYISNPLDPLTWDPLDFAEKTGSDDVTVPAIWADHDEIYVFGYKTIEVWRNTGNGVGGFPFEQDPGATVQQGVTAPWAICSLSGGVAMLGEDGRGRGCAYLLRGFQPTRVSTFGVEQAWARYTDISDAEAFAYSEAGHEFWVINFPTANATWVYDATTNQWHERAWKHVAGLAGHLSINGRVATYVSGDHFTEQAYTISIGSVTHYVSPHYQAGVFDNTKLILDTDGGVQVNVAYTAVTLDRIRQRVFGWWISIAIAGDWESGILYRQSLDYFDDNAANIVRRRVAAPVSDEEKRMFGKRFQLECESGNGAMTPVLDWSDDRGKTFGTPHAGAVSAQEDNSIRFLWRRLGKWFHRTWRVTIEGQTKVVLTAADLDVEEGTV